MALPTDAYPRYRFAPLSDRPDRLRDRVKPRSRSAGALHQIVRDGCVMPMLLDSRPRRACAQPPNTPFGNTLDAIRIYAIRFPGLKDPP